MGSVWHSKWWQMLLLSPKSPGTGRDGKVRKNSSELVTNWASDKQVRRGRSARQREQPERWLRVELWGPIWALQLTGPHSLPAPDCDQERHSGRLPPPMAPSVGIPGAGCRTKRAGNGGVEQRTRVGVDRGLVNPPAVTVAA